MTIPFRIGQGSDIHALVPGRSLRLGGVEIPHSAGLLGHSDADALLHAITDAVLGAAGLGDIGGMFPDTDDRWRGADSRALLRTAVEAASASGWRIGTQSRGCQRAWLYRASRGLHRGFCCARNACSGSLRGARENRSHHRRLSTDV